MLTGVIVRSSLISGGGGEEAEEGQGECEVEPVAREVDV